MIRTNFGLNFKLDQSVFEPIPYCTESEHANHCAMGLFWTWLYESLKKGGHILLFPLDTKIIPVFHFSGHKVNSWGWPKIGEMGYKKQIIR